MLIQFRPRPDAGCRVGPNGARSFKRQYNLMSNSPNELRSYILNYPSVPAYGSPHPEDFTCTVSDYDLNQMEADPYRWVLEVTWSSNHGNRNEKDDQNQPDQRRPRWSSTFQPISNFLPTDLQGKMFVDSAGMPFDPPPDHPIWVRAITIHRYETTWSEARDLTLINATNTDSWRQSQPGEVLISSVANEETWLMGAYWFSYTYTLLQNPKILLPGGAGTIGGWDPLLLVDQGPKIKGPAGTPIDAPDPATGTVDGRSFLLNGAGQRQTPNTYGSYTPVYLSFQVKQRVAFAPLSLIAPWESGYVPFGTAPPIPSV